MRRIGIGATLLLVASTSLWGADFWEEKEYSQWTDKELGRLMMNSPWAKEVLVQRGGGGGPALRGDSVGGAIARNGRMSPGDSGRGGGGGGAVGSGGGRGGGQGPPPMKLWVRWNSADPIKQGVIRRQIGAEGEANQDHLAFLGREEPHYVVSVSGLPQQMARMAQDTERLKAAATLERKSKNPIAPESVEVQSSGESVALYFMFPKADAIAMSDKEVEFVMTLQGGGGGENQGARGGRGGAGGGARGLEVKRKFKLKDMVVNGELTL